MNLLKRNKSDFATFLDLANSKTGAEAITDLETGKHYVVYKGVRMYELSEKLFDYLVDNKIVEVL